MPEFFSTPDDTGEIRQSELQSSLGERLSAQARDALDPKDSLSGMWLFRRTREANAGGAGVAVPGAAGEVDVFGGRSLEEQQQASEAFAAAVPDTAIADAKARVKQEGLEGRMTLPDQPSIKSPVLELMIQEAHERRDREAAIARGPQGFLPGALGAVTSLGAGMIDPVNMAAFSIPVLGEARWGKLMASAGDSLVARAGVRALQGGAQGAVGTAVLQPADWWLHSQDGQDYTFADALKSVVMGAGMGAAFHAGFGGAGDVMARLRGRPLPGSSEDLLTRGLLTGTHIPGSALAEEGVSGEEVAGLAAAQAPAGPEDVPGVTPTPSAGPTGGPSAATAAPARATPLHPAEILADLPPAAQEDLVRSAISDIAADRPVRAAELLQIAADHDPRIAESIEAWHGSPHDFDRFDIGKVGSGEGAQSFGRGLYFAQEKTVAEGYARELAAWKIDGEPPDPTNPAHVAAATLKGYNGDVEGAVADLKRTAEEGPQDERSVASAAIEMLRRGDKLPDATGGNLYKVRITANHEHFLDYDAPLAGQNAHVRDALAAIEKANAPGTSPSWDLGRQLALMRKGGRDLTAGQFLHVMQSVYGEAKAAEMLRDAGIPGIKYLDKGSRVSGEGTRNFVVFDDKHVEIVNKNGEPVRPAEMPVQSQRGSDIPGKTYTQADLLEAQQVYREAKWRTEQPENNATHERFAADAKARLDDIERSLAGQTRPKSSPAVAAADPRWRELADAPAADREPEAVAESKEADRVEEPASLVPEKAMTAAEQAAADAEEVWRRVEPNLSEEERRVVNDALDRIKTDKAARDQIITDGAACLMAAAA